ncbi:hypothetical protein P153DRAFT_369576 [Dothidotthia symphoricarpi CBS 119687]|uniref:C3H1-type domain-containing protein n=1 Tax=Dothidotthia symphoricarpi CBS 119687 TaxID=1392245 RepID=A0A6A6A6I5_9PLEO|nr:uncharacterized protein P153DRAFT_369576 [Dothidotthia symphoricarpi CBS 119687]KAF2126231.1 hypothetical protein P153DRAFT_369576 [Dothidotthia symphoricarpi CBS 119687]
MPPQNPPPPPQGPPPPATTTPRLSQSIHSAAPVEDPRHKTTNVTYVNAYNAGILHAELPHTQIVANVKSASKSHAAPPASWPRTAQNFANARFNDGLVYQHDNGRAAPWHYADVDHDLFLCFETFMTIDKCPHGRRCRYRHSKLEAEEVRAIAQTKQGEIWLDKYCRCWPAGGVPEYTGYPIAPTSTAPAYPIASAPSFSQVASTPVPPKKNANVPAGRDRGNDHGKVGGNGRGRGRDRMPPPKPLWPGHEQTIQDLDAAASKKNAEAAAKFNAEHRDEPVRIREKDGKGGVKEVVLRPTKVTAKTKEDAEKEKEKKRKEAERMVKFAASLNADDIEF